MAESLEGKVVADGKYRIIEPLGAGGFGATVKATQYVAGTQLGVVAMKMSLRPLRTLAEGREFLQEAAALRAVSHPNIVALHDAFIDQDIPYLVMEHVKGHTLGQALSLFKDLGLGTVLWFGMQIAHAIDALHAKGVIHCDLKPNNILVGPWVNHLSFDFIKIIDFGLAARWEEGGWKMSGGTLGFAAPEQFLGAPTPRSDVFSFGVLLYWMLSGRLPYAPESCLTPELWMGAEPPSLPAGVPPELRELVAHCLCLNAKDRYPRMPIEPLRAIASSVRVAGSDIAAKRKEQEAILKMAKDTFSRAGLTLQRHLVHDATA